MTAPAGDLPRLTYLSVDSITQGVGASQVLPYVEALARLGVGVSLHSMENGDPVPALAQRLTSAGVAWHPHRWGSNGSMAGLARLARGARYVTGAPLVHARSDIPAGSALLARCRSWVWDMRGFWADERIAQGLLRPGSPQDRLMRVIERGSARQAGAIVTLTRAAVDVLARRHGEGVREITTVIPTCVDTERFVLAPMPDSERLQLVLSGSFNQLYDLRTTLGLVAAIRARRPADLALYRPQPSSWDAPVREAGGSVESVPFAQMPARLKSAHAGLSLRRTDAGDSLAGCAPTKLAELLATGRPVVVNAGLGDMDELLAKHNCGVVVRDSSPAGLAEAAEQLCSLVADDDTPRRCRAAVEDDFRLDRGVTRLIEVYRRALTRR